MEYITEQKNLQAFVERAEKSSLLAVDTEFLREKTYYAKLCLLQFATDNEVVIVDPFAVCDLKVLNPLFLNDDIVKVFHAAGQDLEIIYHELGVLPHPLFDTQLAAALLGQSCQIGYGALVQTMCDVALKKNDSYTDWSARPLSESQLKYAADDVVYLPKLYHTMKAELEDLHRLHWLDSDFEDLIDPDRYVNDPRQWYRRLKRANQLTRRQLAAAREVSAWREERARERNIPRKWILSDEQIVEACKRDSYTIDDLFLVRGIREHLSMHDAREIVALMNEGYNLPPEQWPELDHSTRSEPNVDFAVDLMTALVRLRAKENNIAMQTLANNSDLVLVARGHTDDVDVVRGWRAEIVGNELLDLLAGRITLSLEDGNLSVKYNDDDCSQDNPTKVKDH